jgi:hypothetical protein
MLGLIRLVEVVDITLRSAQHQTTCTTYEYERRFAIAHDCVTSFRIGIGESLSFRNAPAPLAHTETAGTGGAAACARAARRRPSEPSFEANEEENV